MFAYILPKLTSELMFMPKMAGQVAIVTGGAMGIGKEFVKVLLSRNAKVVIADLNYARGQETINEIKKQQPDVDITFENCDVTVHSQFKDVFQRTKQKYGRIDILVNNAGIMDESVSDKMLSVNMTAVVHGTNLGMMYMSKTKGGNGGSIINMASVAGLMPFDVLPVYCATKFAVVGFTQSIGASSLEDHGVRVNCICPDGADTDLMRLAEHKFYGGKVRFERFKARLARGKLMDPATVAACLHPLLDDVTLSGKAMLCSAKYPHKILQLPTNLKSYL